MLPSICVRHWFWPSFSTINQLEEVAIFLSQTKTVIPIHLLLNFECCILQWSLKFSRNAKVHQTGILAARIYCICLYSSSAYYAYLTKKTVKAKAIHWSVFLLFFSSKKQQVVNLMIFKLYQIIKVRNPHSLVFEITRSVESTDKC